MVSIRPISFFFGLFFVFSGCSEAPPPDPTGTWQAVVEERQGDFYREYGIEIELIKSEDGQLAGIYAQKSPRYDSELQDLEYEKGNLSWQIDRLSVKFEGRVKADGSEIVGTLQSDENAVQITFQRDLPGFNRYRLPRVDDEGNQQTDYTYAPPEDLGDGWQISTLAEEGLDEALITEMVKSILQGEIHLADSIVIVKNGKIVFEEYFHGAGPQNAHAIESAAKSVVSMVIGTAVDRDLIGPPEETLIYPLFQERTSNRWVKEKYPLALSHLLSMTTGLAWADTAESSSTAAMMGSEDWPGHVLDLELAGTPGAVHNYSNGEAVLLADIVLQSTGRPVEDIADEFLFSLLGIKNYKWGFRPDGTAFTAGGMEMTSRDMAKLGQVMLDRGVWQGTRVLSESWVEQSTSQQTKAGDYTFGYLWHIVPAAGGGIAPTPVDMYTAAGHGGQMITVIPELNMVIIQTSSNFEGQPPHIMITTLRYILPAALKPES